MTPDPTGRCPRCGAELIDRHCEQVCPNHGVVADCADPFGF